MNTEAIIYSVTEHSMRAEIACNDDWWDNTLINLPNNEFN